MSIISEKTFKAMVSREVDYNKYSSKIENKSIKDLPEGEVLINVKYSSLNYKDALSSIGNKGVTKDYPHTPGIDAAGIVVESSNSLYKEGDSVIVAGHDFGMNTDGGFEQYVRVPADWLVKLPEGLSLRDSMKYGTAGFTSAYSVYKILKAGIKPEDGEILVSGATGGVGSIAVAILSKLGYNVAAISGKVEDKEMLDRIGAKSIIDRHEFEDNSGKALLKSRWAGVIDTVGGNILATALKSTKYGAAVTCCGNVASPDLITTVYPFILRSVTLYGVEAVNCPSDLRAEIWGMLAKQWRVDNVYTNITEVSLEQLGAKIDDILVGKIKGRVLINLDL